MPAPGSAPHVLYVAWGFPPCRGGGVYRALATANAFAAGGFRVTVLTASRETFLRYTGADTRWRPRSTRGIEVVRVPFAWPALETDLPQWSAVRALLPPAVAQAARAAGHQATSRRSATARGAAARAAAARDIHARRPGRPRRRDRPTPTSTSRWPTTCTRRRGVPYVMDYRDAWLLDVFDGDLLHDEDSRGRPARARARRRRRRGVVRQRARSARGTSSATRRQPTACTSSPTATTPSSPPAPRRGRRPADGR